MLNTVIRVEKLNSCITFSMLSIAVAISIAD